jgi:apolipoprotein N-acyltransferase
MVPAPASGAGDRCGHNRLVVRFRLFSRRHWIGFAFLVDAPTRWLLPIAVVGLPAGLAIFTAFRVALARLLWTRGALRILALALRSAAGVVARTYPDWFRGTPSATPKPRR